MISKTSRGYYWAAGVLALGVLAIVLAVWPRRTSLAPRLRARASVADRVAQYGPVVRERWQPYFAAQQVAYPPRNVLLVGFKQEKQLAVYAAAAGQDYRLIRTLPILRHSGKVGPKLRYGDFQVPEGFYRIASLNPNSAYHLSLRVSYPNALDRAQAEKDGRTNPGGDIMIHGSNVSIGCLAMGDDAAEDLFVLVAEAGRANTELLLCPVDFRTAPLPDTPNRPAWVSALYADLKAKLATLPRS